MLTVGVGLYAYFQQFPMTPAQLAKVSERSDYIFPIFILQAMPMVVKGLLFASIFAAATQTAAISAMAQTGLSLYERVRRHGDRRRDAAPPVARVRRAVRRRHLPHGARLLADRAVHGPAAPRDGDGELHLRRDARHPVPRAAAR